VSAPPLQGIHQTRELHHLFERVLVYVLIRDWQMDIRCASTSIVGCVHSRATPAFVNPPVNGTIRLEGENQPIRHFSPTGALPGRSTIPVDFFVWMWQVDLTIAPFTVPFLVNQEVGVPASVSCIRDMGTDGRCRGSTTGNV